MSAAGDPLGRRGLLIVSLPRNDAALAKAAASAGADLLKAHINVRHRASGTRFGSLEDEEDRLDAILKVGLPTGLVPGEEMMVTREEIPRLRRFAFLDAYVHRLPLFLYDVGVPVIPAIPHDYPHDAMGSVTALPGDWLEAALVPPEGYGAITHVWAVMIGVIVTGRAARSLGRATEAFRRALDGLLG